MRRRSGFTLVEMILAAGLSAVVAAELVAIMVGIFRLEKNKMWNAEFADRLRIARESLLFKSVAPEGDKVYGGLLSATNIYRSGNQLVANFARTEKWKAAEFDSRARNSVDLFENRFKDRFSIDGLDDGTQEIADAYVTNGLAFITVRASIRSATSAENPTGVSNRIERIALPVLDGKGLGEGSFLWEDFVDITEGDGYARWIYP